MNSPISRSRFLINEMNQRLASFNELQPDIMSGYPKSPHKIYFSFQYIADSWRARLIRNLDIADGNHPAAEEHWRSIRSAGPDSIRDWIERQMEGRDCTVVLVGSHTAGRAWINHEIIKSWQAGMGVVGIRIHGLENAKGRTATRGRNPFSYIDFGDKAQRLSSVINCCEPEGSNSQQQLAWIGENLARLIEQAVQTRDQY